PLSCGDEQGALRGIPHEYGMRVLLAQFGIVTRGGTSEHMVQERLWRSDGVALRTQGEAPGARDHGTRRHRTERQRAGLVAADDLRTPEGLDRWQASHQDMATDHALHTESERHGDYGR